MRFRDVPKGFLPPGFLAIDLAKALGLPLYDQHRPGGRPGEGMHPARRGA